MRTKILEPHAHDCYACDNVEDGRWDTPWAFIKDGLTFYADTLGRMRRDGRGTHRWLVVICNASNCGGKIAVFESDILNALPGLVNARRKRARR